MLHDEDAHELPPTCHINDCQSRAKLSAEGHALEEGCLLSARVPVAALSVPSRGRTMPSYLHFIHSKRHPSDLSVLPGRYQERLLKVQNEKQLLPLPAPS